LITRPRQRAWKLVAVVVSAVALFCLLSGEAVAQGIAEVPEEDIQNANQYIDDLSTTGPTLQPQSEPVAGGAVTAKPGESPWLMDQQRFDPEATPAQTTNEVEQIFAGANQSLMEGDSSTIAPVQEPLLPTAAETATIEPVTEVPEISSSTPEEPTASNASWATSESVASDPVDSTWRSKPPLSIYERRLLAVGVLVLTFGLVGLIGLWKLYHVHPVSFPDIIRGISKQSSHTRVAELKSITLCAPRTTDVARRCRDHRVKRTSPRRDHRKHKDL
jgi:hypothetical protein